MGGKPKPDWIVAHDGTQGEKAYAIECLRCGTVQKVGLPISIDCYVALGRAFGKEHSRCRAPRPSPLTPKKAVAQDVPPECGGRAARR